jgi:pyrrolysine biosynthesis protein PylD
MTRLTAHDIRPIPGALLEYESDLIAKTGCSLRQVACKAMGLRENEVQGFFEKIRVAVIPVTAGEGLLKGFCSAVASIVTHVGCLSFVTEAHDIAGFNEALGRGADIVMLADDDCFIACHLQSRRIINNSDATGKGFARGLDLMAGGLNEQEVLVIGCGPVGQAAIRVLINLNAAVSVFDINLDRCLLFCRKIREKGHANIRIVSDLNQVLGTHDFILDASPAEDIIHATYISRQTHISAPGIPMGLDESAQAKIGNRLLHDSLQIGVATMTVGAAMAHKLNSPINHR